MNFELKRVIWTGLLCLFVFCPSLYAWIPCHFLIHAANHRIREASTFISGPFSAGMTLENFEDLSLLQRVRDVRDFLNHAIEHFSGSFSRSEPGLEPPFVAASFSDDTADQKRIMNRLVVVNERLDRVEVKWDLNWGRNPSTWDNLPLVIKGKENIHDFFDYLETQCLVTDVSVATSAELNAHYGLFLRSAGVVAIVCGAIQAYFHGGVDFGGVTLFSGGLTSLWMGGRASGISRQLRRPFRQVDYNRFRREMIQPQLAEYSTLGDEDILWLTATDDFWELDMALGHQDGELVLMLFSGAKPEYAYTQVHH